MRISKHKKKGYFFKTVVGVTIVTSLTTCCLLIGCLIMTISVSHNEKSVEALSSHIQSLDEQLTVAQEEEQQYKSQQEQLKQQISKCEPVVIPDSMKK